MTENLFIEFLRETNLLDWFKNLQTQLAKGQINSEEFIQKTKEVLTKVQIPSHLEAAILQEYENYENFEQEPNKAQNRKTLIVGNGDILSLEQGYNLARDHDLDGIMVGRGIFQDIWLFNPLVARARQFGWEPTILDKLKILELHLYLWLETWQPEEQLQKNLFKKELETNFLKALKTDSTQKIFSKQKRLDILKKYFKIYINGFHGASQLRAKIMDCKNFQEIYELLQQFKSTL